MSAVTRILCLSSIVFTATMTTNLTAAKPNDQKVRYSLGDVNVSVSHVYAHVFKKTSLGHEHAIEGTLKEGHINFNNAKTTGYLIFDMRSFHADTDQARRFVGLEGSTSESMRKQVDDNMRGNGVLDINRYPTARFDIESITNLQKKSKRGLPLYELRGQFTLHGKKRPISVTAEASEKKGWTHLRGGFQIRQTDFGITPFTKAFGAIGVADQMKIYGDLWIAGTRQQIASRQAATR